MNKTERERPNWDVYGMSLAYAARLRSPDPHYQVGACALRQDRSVAATGYNGAPAGVEIDWTDRIKRRGKVIHAEKNCLRYTKRGEVHYLYCTLSPCAKCFEMIRLHGVKEIIFSEIYEMDMTALAIAPSHNIICRQLKI